MDLHQASRAAALAYSFWTTWRVWAPPKNALVSSDEAAAAASSTSKVDANGKTTKALPAHTGWEVSMTPTQWRILFATSVSLQVIFQIWVFQYYSGGWRGFINAPWTYMDILALVCMGAAARLRRSAYKTLGKYFTYKVHFTKDQELITASPYTKLMHPGYTALLLHILPFFWWIGLQHDLRVLALYTAIGLVPFLRRIIDEEKALEKHFGKAKFEEYKTKRWHLIPLVW